MAQNWTPNTWRQKPIQQVPDYPDAQALVATEAQLATFRRWSLPVKPAG